MNPTDIEAAARLVAFGLRARHLPSRDTEYANLLRRFAVDSDFAEMVHATATGLGLVVLAASVRAGGVVLAAAPDSVFEVKMDDYARQAKLRDRQTEKVIHGITHLAAAALSFPRADDLADDTYVGRVSVDHVDRAVRDICRLLDEHALEQGVDTDVSVGAPELERVWRAYARRPETATTRNSGHNPVTTRAMVSRALRWLAEQGMLVQTGSADAGTYRTTSRYQIHVRQLASHAAFEEVVRLGPVPGPSATTQST